MVATGTHNGDRSGKTVMVLSNHRSVEHEEKMTDDIAKHKECMLCKHLVSNGHGFTLRKITTQGSEIQLGRRK
jgi:hypothetical protein